MSATMSLQLARELHAKAQADDQPTPRAAMAVLLAHEAAELARLEAARDDVYDRLRALALRANYIRDRQGRGLPERHPDRMSLNDLVAVTGKHRTTVNHWMEELMFGPIVKRDRVVRHDQTRARPDLIPTYKLTADPVAGPPA